MIIECGTKHGGSAFFLAKICDLIGVGKIVSIDIEAIPGRPEHDRITYILGSSTAEEIVAQVKSLIQKGDKVMVILDSLHRADHVLNELRAYHTLVTKGNYLIVEDTVINGHPTYCNYGPGPMEALETFLKAILST